MTDHRLHLEAIVLKGCRKQFTKKSPRDILKIGHQSFCRFPDNMAKSVMPLIRPKDNPWKEIDSFLLVNPKPLPLKTSMIVLCSLFWLISILSHSCVNWPKREKRGGGTIFLHPHSFQGKRVNRCAFQDQQPLWVFPSHPSPHKKSRCLLCFNDFQTFFSSISHLWRLFFCPLRGVVSLRNALILKVFLELDLRLLCLNFGLFLLQNHGPRKSRGWLILD